MKNDLLNRINNPNTPLPVVCKFCNKSFRKETTLISHVCENKRRHMAKNERHVKIGFYTFKRFYDLTHKKTQEKTYDDFTKSSFYNAFVKFGSFVSNISPLYTKHFIDWIIKSGVKLDNWCNQSLYEKYVLELIHTESVETALERSLKTMQSWADNNNSQWNHYFLYVSVNRLMYDIMDGKISPWLLLNCKSGKAALGKLLDEQLNQLSNIIDPIYWSKKFNQSKEDLIFISQIVKDSDL